MLDTLRQIAKGSTLYYKQLNFFLVLALVMVGSLAIQSQFSPENVPQAATELPKELSPVRSSDEANYSIGIEPDGSVKVNNKNVGGTLIFENERDKFLLIIVRDSPQFINSITATVRLPYPVDDVESLLPRIYAIHGVTQSGYRVIDHQTVEFTAFEIFDGSTVSIEFTFPKTYLSLSPLGKLKQRLATLSPETWLVIAIIFPALTVLFLLYLVFKRFWAFLRVQNSSRTSQPPTTTPPAIIGALYHGHIGKKEITATFFDLALRGFIGIHQSSDGEIAFTKGTNLFNQSAATLRPFEIFLLHQLFGDEGFISHGRSVEVGLNSELFSSRVAMSMLNIYDAALAEGYFIQSPNSYYLKYKAIGLVLFFIALAALLFGAFTLPARGYVLFLWVGMIAASLLIITVTPGLPRRTRLGDKILKQWIGFRNYLSVKEPISKGKSSEFFAYLPYAIVMNCEAAWIARWSTQTLVLPEWYSADASLYTAEDYGRSLVSVINYLARSLIAARPPDLA